MTQKSQPLLWKEVDDMPDKAEYSELIQRYSDLRRILKADDPKKEAEYQIQTVKARLAAYGDTNLEALDNA